MWKDCLIWPAVPKDRKSGQNPKRKTFLLPAKKTRKTKKTKNVTREKTAKESSPAAESRSYRGFTLNSFQVRSVEAIDRKRSVLVSAPTGAGKTLIAEYAVEKAIESGKRAIYTAPIKALSNQKYRDFKEILGDDVGIMTGDITLNPGAPLLIMTTEIFRNTVYEGNLELEDVEFVIFDEIHFMDDADRGTVWEESIIFAPKTIRFVCLSATISNLKEFGKWISLVRGEEIEVIRSMDRPVPLTHYLFFPDFGPTRADKVTSFPRRKKRGRNRFDREDLLYRLQMDEKLPVLYFCFSRKECEKRACWNRRMKLLSPEERKKMEVLVEGLCGSDDPDDSDGSGRDATLAELKRLALEGVGYHHAGLLPRHKEIVERLFTSGLLKLLFTTETFALGINMPAHTVIFSSLRKFDGVGFGPLMTRQYQQMAGRAGRQGIDREGFVYSIIEDRRVTPGDVRRLISNDVEPVRSRFNLSYSTLLNLHAHLGDKIFDAWEQSFNNFQWTRTSRKKRDKNKKKQIDLIKKKLSLLGQLEYIRDDGLTKRGKVAALINGFEIQVTELLFAGILSRLDEVQINVMIAAVVFEERKGNLFKAMDRNLLGPEREEMEKCVNSAIVLEKSLAIPPTLKPLDFKIGAAVAGWCRGLSFVELEDYAQVSSGDLVRTFRLTIQLIRQIRKAMPADRELAQKLSICIDILNRGEVDALRQLNS